jgi:hypothetical protein
MNKKPSSFTSAIASGSIGILHAEHGIMIGNTKITEKDLADFLEAVTFLREYTRVDPEARAVVVAMRARKRILGE